LIYLDRRQKYVGIHSLVHNVAEHIERVSCKMELGKAAGLDELTVEHVVNSHLVLIIILAELFNVVMATAHVPYGFRLSYTVAYLYQTKTLAARKILSIITELYLLVLCCRKYLNSVY